MHKLKILFLIGLICVPCFAFGQAKPKRDTSKDISAVIARKKALVAKTSENTNDNESVQDQQIVLPYNIPSYTKAADYYALAMKGDKEAMCKLGKSFLNGENGVNKDNDDAFQWFSKASELGHANAMAWLGDCYLYAWGCASNPNAAFLWSKRSAENGDPYGCNNLGYCYSNGVGTSKDSSQAFYWYLKSAESGDVNGQTAVAFAFLQGDGTTKEESKAFYWMSQAANQENAIAQYVLGMFYANGTGCTANANMSYYWLKKSADQGNGYAQYSVGICYYKGLGVSTNKDTAASWFKMAAEKGIEGAQEFYEKAYKEAHTFASEPQYITIP